MNYKKTISTCLAGLFISQSGYADHGRDFLVVQDAHIGEAGHGSVGVHGGWTRFANGSEEFSLDSTVFLPLMDRVALGAGLHLDESTGGFGFTSVSPHAMFGLTPKDSKVKISFLVGYQFGEDVAVEEEEPHADEAEEAEGHSHGEESEHDGAEGDEAAHSHSHGGDALELRLIAETDLTSSTKLAANIYYIDPKEGEGTFGYAIGVRHLLTEQFAVGVEAVGDFEKDSSQEAFIGTYFSPTHDLTLKAGVGFGLTDESPDISTRLGVVWRF